MKHVLAANESFILKKNNLEKDVLVELENKINYKSYSDYQEMDADVSSENGTIGWDEDEENFYIFNSSNGVWEPIGQPEETGIPIITVQTTGNVSQQLAPNTFYKFGSIDSLTITLTAGEGLSIYAGKFTTSSNWGGVGLNLPVTITEAANNDTIEAEKTYEYNIMDNVIVIKEVA